MTVIVAVRKAGKLYFGSDSYIGTTSNKHQSTDKCYKKGGVIFASSGSPRVTQIAQYHINFNKSDVAESLKEMTPLEWAIRCYIPLLRTALKEHGSLAVYDGVEHMTGNTEMLIGVAGMLLNVDSDFQVGIAVEDYYAIGAGMHHALGSLASTIKLPPKLRVKIALKATKKHNPFANKPFRYFTN